MLRLYELSMERKFLSSKEKGGGVKEKKVGSAGGSSLNLGEDTSSNVVNKTDLAGVSSGPNTTRPSCIASRFCVVCNNIERIYEWKKCEFLHFNYTGGNVTDVVVPLDSIQVLSERFANSAYGSFWESGWLISLLLTMSSYARAMIELRIDVELKDIILLAMPKLVDEGFYMCTIRVEYE
nr:hypothetical protein [Tanacetum cinerariifolium]